MIFWDVNPLPVAVTTKILVFLGSGIQESKPFFATGIGVDASCVSPNFVGFSQLKTHWIPSALHMKNGAGLKMYVLLKMGIFHCDLILPEGKTNNFYQVLFGSTIQKYLQHVHIHG